MNGAFQSYKSKFYIDLIIIILIIAISILFFAYNLAPANTNLWDLKLFKLYSGSQWDIDFYMWQIATKSLTISLISIWFITCKHWWRYSLFVPTAIEIFKLLSLINQVYLVVDDISIVKTLPFAFLYCLLLIYIGNRSNFYSKHKNFNHQLNQEIDELTNNLSKFKNRDYKTYKEALIRIRKGKPTLDKRAYLTKLIQLRDQMDGL